MKVTRYKFKIFQMAARALCRDKRTWWILVYRLKNQVLKMKI